MKCGFLTNISNLKTVVDKIQALMSVVKDQRYIYYEKQKIIINPV